MQSELIGLKFRLLYILSIGTLIILGLGSRQFPEALPAFIVQHAGDVCWAAMIYYGFRFIYLDMSRLVAIGISLCFCSAIEFSQIYQAAWIQDIRQTLLGSLILGKGFLVVDLIRYAAGIGIAAVIDYGYKRVLKRP